MNSRDKIFKICKKLSDGQYFKSLEYNQFIKNPKIFNHAIQEVETINNLYKALKDSPLYPIERTPSGGIKKWNIHHDGGAWDWKEVYTKQNVFKGVIITVIIFGFVFVFKCGAFGTNKGNITGKGAFEMFAKECKKQNIDLQKYASNDGLKIKQEIKKPYIKNFVLRKKIKHVHHLDLNAAWPSAVCRTYPEFTEVFAKLRKKDKLIADVALGFCQSEYINYKYAELAKIGINETNKKIIDLYAKLEMNNFEVIGLNTDGIWYRDKTDENRIYHDEEEGTQLNQWKTDHKDCTFCAYSDGQYWFIEDGKFNVRARGYYLYEQVKPREEWDELDFDRAMSGLLTIRWDEQEGFVIHEAFIA